jgi:hypothetical protein
MIREIRKPGDPPRQPLEVDFGPEEVMRSESKRTQCFVPPKTILIPLTNEGRVSYGDRLLWHQLALQLNNRHAEMLTEDEYVDTVRGFYPEAVEDNVRNYRNYFNSRHKSMGFRNIEMPVPVEFAVADDVSI